MIIKFLDGKYINELTGKEVLQISFSGGRTSAYMTEMMISKYSDCYDFIVTFANTGMEHEQTLKFIYNCDQYFGFNTIWLEADVQHGERKGTGFNIIDYETASRKGEVFEDVIKKYGIPNPSYLHCTRELKLQPMRSYLKSLGIDHKLIKTAIGIRVDETRRVSNKAEIDNIVYPLIDWFPTDKQEVNQWWSAQWFDLGLEDYNGNCRGCFKKSFKKIFAQIDEDVGLITDYHERWENLYGHLGKKDGHTNRVFFRGNVSALELSNMYKEDRSSDNPTYLTKVDLDENSGCSESCEVYFTE